MRTIKLAPPMDLNISAVEEAIRIILADDVLRPSERTGPIGCLMCSEANEQTVLALKGRCRVGGYIILPDDILHSKYAWALVGRDVTVVSLMPG